MGKGAKKSVGQSGADERQIRLKKYYKVVTIYTLVVAIIYGALFIVRQQGYQLINAQILYWLWFALAIGVILLVGKYIANLPKDESTRKGVRISVALVSIATILFSYMTTISKIDSGLMKYATLTSPDGVHTVIVMRADTKIAATETEEAKVYTAYTAYPRINRFFCNTKGYDDFILLYNDEAATMNKEWTDDKLILTVDSDALQSEDGTIEVPLSQSGT